MAERIKFIFLAIFLVIKLNNGSEDVPYWSEMARLIKLQSVDTRIINGEDAQQDQAPWMVSLTQKHNDEHFCGGVLISESTVLTAAHCFIKNITSFWESKYTHKPPSSILVKYDGVNQSSLNKVSEVAEVILHPNWRYDLRKNTLYGDLAIINLQEPVIESETVKIIKIVESAPPPGSDVILTGWGHTAWDQYIKYKLPSLLQSARLTIISREQCDQMMSPYPPSPPIYICATNPKETPCKGDSGSGLTFEGKLVGIASHGLPNCPLGGPFAYTNPVMART